MKLCICIQLRIHRLLPSIRVSQPTASSLGQLLDDLILARKIVSPVSA